MSRLDREVYLYRDAELAKLLHAQKIEAVTSREVTVAEFREKGLRETNRLPRLYPDEEIKTVMWGRAGRIEKRMKCVLGLYEHPGDLSTYVVSHSLVNIIRLDVVDSETPLHIFRPLVATTEPQIKRCQCPYSLSTIPQGDCPLTLFRNDEGRDTAQSLSNRGVAGLRLRVNGDDIRTPVGGVNFISYDSFAKRIKLCHLNKEVGKLQGIVCPASEVREFTRVYR